MCAVVGAYLENPSSLDLVTLADVFRESSIRGLHATGISWVRGGQIHTHIDSVPATKFLDYFNLGSCINEDGNLYLIGHCRYSTSDLAYNQPMYNENVSIAHNGVVSQEMPENWERLYGYKCKTRNDSELIVHTLEANKSPLEEFPNASMAVVELYKEKKIRFYRNGKRPIYFTSLRNGGIITSTKDIAVRADLKEPAEVGMNQYVTMGKGLFQKEYVHIEDAKDLQHVS
ncbi:MAG: hypothetical protein EBU08_18105 [Micrococcales bacterium]|nr:hypothetical protein [Micrococcales bacterium]